ncbi:holo-ACP synthase [Nitratifractor sp.]|uniref:holo-ACP synthase n=1 Tax=Nitratifractor sp. TaxID=2268144 RepID=UPI0025F15995|nr:holo-ACP synthase [Nitratifractor sp.]
MIRVGTDIVVIERIAKSYARFGERFLRRYLKAEEYESSTSDASLAGLWAAKEAVAKALGCGIGSELSFLDIIIRKDQKGAPQLQLAPEALKRFPVRESSLSISHDGGFAMAVVVLELDGQKA